MYGNIACHLRLKLICISVGDETRKCLNCTFRIPIHGVENANNLDRAILTKQRSGKRISDGVKVGVIAIIINLITVFVYIYQTNLMQKQQNASVWPYIEWEAHYVENEEFKIQVSNNGIGPALVLNTTIKVNGKVQPNVDSLLTALVDTRRIPYLRGDIDRRVLPAGARINLIETKDPKWSELLYYAIQDKKLEIEICYESIYKEQWLSIGKEAVESKCN